MQRRDFITLLGGITAGWPLTSRAQQVERMRRIGVLMPSTADDSEYQARLGAFLQALTEALLQFQKHRNCAGYSCQDDR